MQPPRRLLVFLSLDPNHPDRRELVLTPERRLGLDPERAASVRAAWVPRALVSAERAAFAEDLQTLRQHPQDQRNGSGIFDPAQRVFSNLDFRGLTMVQLEAMLGPPVRKEREGDVWVYTFHDGDQGVMPRLWFGSDGTVERVRLEYGR